MVDIPESLLRRQAEAKAKALGVPVEQVLAEMKGEGPPVEVPAPEEPRARPDTKEMIARAYEAAKPEEARAEEAEKPSGEEPTAEEPAAEEPAAEEPAVEEPAAGEAEQPAAEAPATEAGAETGETPAAAEEPARQETAAPAATLVEERQSPGGDGKVAGLVSPRPSVPPTGLPEGVRTQRLLTVVKARAIQAVKGEPVDKVNVWPHLMLQEFGALLAVTGVLVVLSVIIHSPLLDPANFNLTPNPSKAPWYFLGLQELLSYFDPQIAGVMVPTFTGLIGFMIIPYVDRNPSTRPSDRKFAIMLFSIFIAGAATLTMFGVLFRGRGFNFSYPWKDGVFFDDLKDWVDFE